MPEPTSPAGTSVTRLASARRVDWAAWAGGLVLVAGTLAVYAQTRSVPLLLDDASSIAENISIRRLWPVWEALSPPDAAGVGGRPLLNFSYALNYALGGASASGYHAVNLLIHVAAGLVLFALVRRTLRRPGLDPRFGPSATPLALAVSALWLWHPLQTESVTYLSQRAESMMGLFYLLTLLCFAHGAETDDRKTRRRWFIGSALACLASVATKEVAVTAPVMVLLYDRTFHSGTFANAWRRHRSLYGALAATWLVLGGLLIGLGRRGVGFGHGVSAWEYGLVECRAVVKYAQLTLWPSPLIFDYGEFVAPSPSLVWPYVFILAALLTAAGIAWRRSPMAGFAAAGFFLLLAPTSSLVPIVGQPIAESRAYLPSAALIALIVIGAFARIGRWSLAGLAIVAIVLGSASVRRNQDYATAATIWSDTIAKCPDNARAHNNLGEAWLKTPGHATDALAQFQAALRLKPDFAEAHNNLGNAWANIPGRLNDAIAEYEAALRAKPDFAEAHNNLGHALLQAAGRRDEAVLHLQEALRLKPEFAAAHNNLGNAWAETPAGLTAAIAEYREALRVKPDFAEAHLNLGNLLLRSPGGQSEAVAQLEEALDLEPELTAAHFALANALIEIPGRWPDAVAHLDTALRLKPDFAEAHFALGNALLQVPDRVNDAITHFQQAVRLKPELAEAHFNLGNAWLSVPGHIDDALAEYQTTLRLKPDYPEAHFNLANVWATLPTRRSEAVLQYQAALRLRPDYPEAHFNLAVALLKIGGRNDEAAFHLRAFLKLRPENDAARQLLERIRAAGQ